MERMVTLSETEATDAMDSIDALVLKEVKKEARCFEVPLKLEQEVQKDLIDDLFNDLLADTVNAMSTWPGV